MNEKEKLLHTLSNKIISIQGKALRIKKAQDLSEAQEQAQKLQLLGEEAAMALKEYKDTLMKEE